jgi:hypothetical protein
MKTMILLIALLIPNLCYGEQHMEILKNGARIVIAQSDSDWVEPDTQLFLFSWPGKQSNWHWVDKGRTEKYPYGYWQWESKPLTNEEQTLEELKRQTCELIKIRMLIDEIRIRCLVDTLIGVGKPL